MIVITIIFALGNAPELKAHSEPKSSHRRSVSAFSAHHEQTLHVW